MLRLEEIKFLANSVVGDRVKERPRDKILGATD